MSLRSASYLFCGGLAWLVVVYRLRDLRRKRDDFAHWALLVATFAGGAAYFLITPQVYLRFDALAGIPNLAVLVTYSFIMVFSAAIVTMLLLWTYPAGWAWRFVRGRLVFYAAAQAATAVAFALADTPAERPVDFDARYGGEPAVGTFLLVFVGSFGYGLVSMARLGWRYAPVSGST
jgi:hypothetical protein